MISKKRKVLCAIIGVALLMLGVFIDADLFQELDDTVEGYTSAAIIEDPSQLLDADSGKVFLYGEVYADDPVTFPEIDGEYLIISKITERYSTNFLFGWWGYRGCETLLPEKNTILTVDFPKGTLKIPTHSLSLENITANGWQGDCIYQDDDTRYRYVGIENHVSGTVFADLHDNTLENPSSLHLGIQPSDIIAIMQYDKKSFTAHFGPHGLV